MGWGRREEDVWDIPECLLMTTLAGFPVATPAIPAKSCHLGDHSCQVLGAPTLLTPGICFATTDPRGVGDCRCMLLLAQRTSPALVTLVLMVCVP